MALLDLAMPLGSGLRLAALVAGRGAGRLGVRRRACVRPLVRRLRPVQVARRIEGHIPGIHNRLVSCIDLDSAAKKAQYSPDFYRQARPARRSNGSGGSARARSSTPGAWAGRSLFAAASVLAFGLAFGLLSDRMPTALARIFSPFADIPPASGVVYTVEPGDAKVLRGEDVTFIAKVEKGEPDRLQLEIRARRRRRATLRYDLDEGRGRSAGGSSLTGFETSFEYRVRGGGTWTHAEADHDGRPADDRRRCTRSCTTPNTWACPSPASARRRWPT